MLYGWRNWNQVMDEMNRMRREFDSRFGSWDRSHNVYPAINIYDDGESFIACAELPGVSAEALDVSVNNNTLTIAGERKPQPVEAGNSMHRRERDYGKFNRSFKLPEPVDSSKVAATFRDGVLEVLMPRAESAKARKVQIETPK